MIGSMLDTRGHHIHLKVKWNYVVQSPKIWLVRGLVKFVPAR